MVTNDNGILCNSISIQNPLANNIVERVHQTIGNIISTFKIQETNLDNENPWEGILSSTMFVLGRSSLCSLRCKILHSMHRHNWYLVGTQLLTSTRKPTGKNEPS